MAILAKKKLIKKLKNAYKKAKSKNQFINIRRLILSNSKTTELSTFKDVFCDLVIAFYKPDKNPIFSFNQLFDNDIIPGLVFETLDIVDS